MSLTVSSGETEYETVPAGQHLAVCYRIIDAGTREEQYKDNPPKKRHSVFLYWELPGEANHLLLKNSKGLILIIS